MTMCVLLNSVDYVFYKKVIIYMSQYKDKRFFFCKWLKIQLI